MQRFVRDAITHSFDVLAPGKRPRVTLTPSMALQDGKPWLAFSIQGGDAQDQHLLQFFLNIVELGMSLQVAATLPAFISDQLRVSFERHVSEQGGPVAQRTHLALLAQRVGEAGLKAKLWRWHH